ncbi:MAG: thioredoxin fold domain-containing protein [Flavobacteriaceae bacterium]|nr:thioredoxin fold domain-containing protein [Flavobacteriaceae bacterium]
MKKILLILVLFVALNSSAQEINWVSIEEAIELQQKEPRKIIMDFYTNWCGPCKLLDKRTFKNKDVSQFINEHYYAVKFNAEGNDMVNFNGHEFTNPNYDPAKAYRRNSTHQLSRYFGVNAFPTIVFLDENKGLITQVKGFQTPQQLEVYLKLFHSNDYKNLKNQEDANAYFKNFKPEFN